MALVAEESVEEYFSRILAVVFWGMGLVCCRGTIRCGIGRRFRPCDVCRFRPFVLREVYRVGLCLFRGIGFAACSMRINVLHWNEDVVMGGRMWCITPPPEPAVWVTDEAC